MLYTQAHAYTLKSPPRTQTHTYTHSHILTHKYMCIYIPKHLRTDTHTPIHKYMCIYTHPCTQAHTHTHTLSLFSYTAETQGDKVLTRVTLRSDAEASRVLKTSSFTWKNKSEHDFVEVRAVNTSVHSSTASITAQLRTAQLPDSRLRLPE